MDIECIGIAMSCPFVDIQYVWTALNRRSKKLTPWIEFFYVRQVDQAVVSEPSLNNYMIREFQKKLFISRQARPLLVLAGDYELFLLAVGKENAIKLIKDCIGKH